MIEMKCGGGHGAKAGRDAIKVSFKNQYKFSHEEIFAMWMSDTASAAIKTSDLLGCMQEYVDDERAKIANGSGTGQDLETLEVLEGMQSQIASMKCNMHRLNLPAGVAIGLIEETRSVLASTITDGSLEPKCDHGHQLKEFVTRTAGTCDLCETAIPRRSAGVTVFNCTGGCNWYLCMLCHRLESEKLENEAHDKLPAGDKAKSRKSIVVTVGGEHKEGKQLVIDCRKINALYSRSGDMQSTLADVQSKNNLPTFKLQADGATRVGSVAPMLQKLAINKKALLLHRELIGQADKRRKIFQGDSGESRLTTVTWFCVVGL